MRPMIEKVFGAILFVAAVPCSASGAELALGDAGIDDDGLVCIPVILAPGMGEEVGGLQSDLLFDGDALVFVSITEGAAAEEASKNINHAAQRNGRVRAIIAGFNQNVLPGGVVALVCFDASTAEEGARLTLGLEGVILSDPFGIQVTAQTRDGIVVVGNSIPLLDAEVLSETTRASNGQVAFTMNDIGNATVFGVVIGLLAVFIVRLRGKRLKQERL